METFIANLSGKSRKEILNGIEYVVAPITMMVPGILKGSQGAMYYPESEIKKHVEIWNNVPVTLNHPYKNGKTASAREPSVIDSQGLGRIFNTKFAKGKLVAEAWIDIARASKRDSRVVDAIMNGNKMEVSTGLYADRDEVSGTHNGQPYNGIVKNFRPDHLAVLPDETGACSVADGCGLMANKKCKCEDKQNCLCESDSSSLEDDPLTANEVKTTMAKKDLIDSLIENCSCWNSDDAETLNGFTVDKLKTLVDNSKEASANEQIANTARDGFEDSNGNSHAFNVKAGKWESEIKPIENSSPEQKSKDEKEQEWLSNAPESVKAVLANAKSLESDTRKDLYDGIVANVESDEVKKAFASHVDELSLKALKSVSEVVANAKPAPPKEEDKNGVARYFGSGPVANKGESDELDQSDILPLPVL